MCVVSNNYMYNRKLNGITIKYWFGIVFGWNGLFILMMAVTQKLGYNYATVLVVLFYV